MIGYKINREGFDEWYFAGVTPEEVAEAIKNEMDTNKGMSVEEIGFLLITPFEVTQKEIENMPEFGGW